MKSIVTARAVKIWECPDESSLRFAASMRDGFEMLHYTSILGGDVYRMHKQVLKWDPAFFAFPCHPIWSERGQHWQNFITVGAVLLSSPQSGAGCPVLIKRQRPPRLP